MNAINLVRTIARQMLFVVLAALAWGGSTQAQTMVPADPPGRVARLNYADGAVSFAPGGTSDWGQASLNRPLTGGDQLWTERGSRSELHIGSTALRIGAETSLSVMVLDDQTAQLSLTQGVLNLKVRSLGVGERLEIDTPNLAFVVSQPGEYRLDVDPSRGVTGVSVQAGAGVVYGENGQSAPLNGRQRVTVSTRNLAGLVGEALPPPDGFDLWTSERDRREDQSVSARYVSRDTTGYEQLDAYGDWQTDPSYGAVWLPRAVGADWAPYREGHWSWIEPWGWTWIDDAPWGFAPFHYGRWPRFASAGPGCQARSLSVRCMRQRWWPLLGVTLVV